jgi:hypothetical protein
MTEANMIKRLEFCVSMIDESNETLPMFKEMDNIVHIDEKWFDMTRVKNTYYLLPEETDPVRTVKNKNNIGKVMFLTAVAKPRYGANGDEIFDGKIGTWAFVKEVAALKKSKNRPKGTLELKTVIVNREVMREYMCKKLIPAIQDKWPDEDLRRTIFIQQDNAKPHILSDDADFQEAVAQSDLNIQLVQQPPNSPDMNVLDLCFFRSLQSMTDNSAPTSIKDLIENVEREYHNYEVAKLARSFITLQSCMRETMKEGGGIGYHIKHMHTERRQLQGRLPIALGIPVELLASTKALIEKAKLEIEKES